MAHKARRTHRIRKSKEHVRKAQEHKRQVATQGMQFSVPVWYCHGNMRKLQELNFTISFYISVVFYYLIYYQIR